MELQIHDYTLPAPISFNFEELKMELTDRVSAYKTIAYTAETIREAKTDRSQLNKLKKSLNDERIRLEKEWLSPFQTFKEQISELVGIVDEAVSAVDKQVKDYEEIQKEDKAEAIAALFDSIVAPEIPWLVINQVWNEKWLNATYKTGQIEKDFAEIMSRIKSDMEMLGRLPEYSFEAQETYKKTLNVNNALMQADYLKQMEEARKLAEINTTANEEPRKKEEPVTCMPEPVEPDMGEFRPMKMWVQFSALMSKEDAVALKEFMNLRNIRYEKLDSADLFDDYQRSNISKVYQNYYCMGLSEIAEEDETAKSVFIRVGLL